MKTIKTKLSGGIKYVLILLTISIFATVANAQEKTLVNVDENGIALSGQDPVAFFTMKKATPGSMEFKSEHKNATYLFSSKANKASFDKAPEKYLPQYGGFCAVSTSMGKIETVDISTWSIVDNKLYVQRNAKAVGMWKMKGPKMVIGKANENWPMLETKYASTLTSKQVTERMELSYEAAKAIAEAALAYEKTVMGPGGSIAVVDAGGALIYLVRPNGTFAAASEVAHEKARSAAMFRMPSKNLEDGILKGRNSLITVGYNMLRGGLPIYFKGQVVGAVGVSGAASADQDLEIAEAGINNAKF